MGEHHEILQFFTLFLRDCCQFAAVSFFLSVFAHPFVHLSSVPIFRPFFLVHRCCFISVTVQYSLSQEKGHIEEGWMMCVDAASIFICVVSMYFDSLAPDMMTQQIHHDPKKNIRSCILISCWPN